MEMRNAGSAVGTTITLTKKMEKALDKFFVEMVEAGYDPVGARGQAVFEAVFNAVYEDWADHSENQMDEDMPNWRDYDDVPEEITVVKED